MGVEEDSERDEGRGPAQRLAPRQPLFTPNTITSFNDHTVTPLIFTDHKKSQPPFPSPPSGREGRRPVGAPLLARQRSMSAPALGRTSTQKKL